MNSPTTLTPASMSDRDLVAAYLSDLAESSLGVDYFLAQEMELRGLRDPATAELTEKGRDLEPVASVSVHLPPYAAKALLTQLGWRAASRGGWESATGQHYWHTDEALGIALTAKAMGSA